ncbi:conserved hypothetical protein [Uncinocarpus reesii 1704]|uniref:Arrestin C-terminal-like domain-containing protein n=1 Tax=Uncinocarpus reesii (strain UAMH 1704) TaxID=336963 RepID=C4JQK8_UNCRE|nr:uncharacterized protein UREG_03353 [Uncinocarpus reesii 1704]EEP78507.1 conserved hypothetical protein [Uncinocarpus reesii 1704]
MVNQTVCSLCPLSLPPPADSPSSSRPAASFAPAARSRPAPSCSTTCRPSTTATRPPSTPSPSRFHRIHHKKDPPAPPSRTPPPTTSAELALPATAPVPPPAPPGSPPASDHDGQPHSADTTLDALLPGLETYANAGSDEAAVEPSDAGRADLAMDDGLGESTFDDLFVGAELAGEGDDLLLHGAEIGELDDSWFASANRLLFYGTPCTYVNASANFLNLPALLYPDLLLPFNLLIISALLAQKLNPPENSIIAPSGVPDRLLLRLSSANPSSSKHKHHGADMRVDYEAAGHHHPGLLRDRLHHLDSASRRSSLASDAGSSVLPSLVNEKVVASGNGITVSIAQAEPVIYLEGFDRREPSKTAMLRGHLHVKVTKPTKVKKIYLSFKGMVSSSWPEGIPGKKGQYNEDRSLMTHTWPFFNAQFKSAEHGYGTDSVQLLHRSKPFSTVDLMPKSGSSTSLDRFPGDIKRLSLQHTPSRSFVKGDSSQPGQTVAQRGYKLFRPGDYIYNFELPIDSRMPETIKTDYASTKYWLDASVERAGVFRPNLLGTKEVLLVRTPSQGSLEQVEPIAISRNWEDQLHYDIVISGKSFPLGAKIPIAFKLTPLAKVACHRIKVYVTESIQQYTTGRTAHRMNSSRQLMLFEKRADSPSVSTYPGSKVRVTAGGGIDWDRRASAAQGHEVVNSLRTSLLGDMERDFGASPPELEFNIVLRLSKPDENAPKKRRHFEISIDSPFHILSCLATQSNIYLPSYTSPSSFPSEEYECGCPGAQPTSKSPSRTNSSGLGELSMLLSLSNDPSFIPPHLSLPRPEHAHFNVPDYNSNSTNNHNPTRPIHLIRLPSFAPPPFEDIPPPPPAMSPPPPYTAATQHDDGGALDYFERLHRTEREYDENTRGNARVDIPLTPGGRVHRSLEIPREAVRVEALLE